MTMHRNCPCCGAPWVRWEIEDDRMGFPQTMRAVREIVPPPSIKVECQRGHEYIARDGIRDVDGLRFDLLEGQLGVPDA